MQTKRISIDFSGIKTLADLHSAFSKAFGFPAFYGANTHALIDCLSSLRYPEAEMTQITLDEGVYLILELQKVDYSNCQISGELLYAVGEVNSRYLKRTGSALIYVLVIS